ncbi:hypothetical protein ACPV5U_27930 [Vibrio mediterranei]
MTTQHIIQKNCYWLTIGSTAPFFALNMAGLPFHMLQVVILILAVLFGTVVLPKLITPQCKEYQWFVTPNKTKTYLVRTLQFTIKYVAMTMPLFWFGMLHSAEQALLYHHTSPIVLILIYVSGSWYACLLLNAWTIYKKNPYDTIIKVMTTNK